MKSTTRRLRRVVWALLLSALMIIEPVAGSMVTYAAEITEEEAALVVEDANDKSESVQEDADDNDISDSSDVTEEDMDSGEDVESGESMDYGEDVESGESMDYGEDVESGESMESEEDVASEEDTLQTPKDIQLPTKEEIEAWAKATGRVPNGYVDIDYEVEGLSEPVAGPDRSFAMATAEVVPKNYDSRNAGKVSSVKNQAGWGTCWAFSAVASAESAYKIQHGGDEINLSESQLVYFFYDGNAGVNLAGPDGGLSGDKTTAVTMKGEDPEFGTPVQRGGNSFLTTFALASWKGVADEATDSSLVYDIESTYNSNDLSVDSKYAYMDAMHLENAYWIPLSDQDSVKKAVMEYGTVGVSYFYDGYFDSDIYKNFVDRSYNGPAIYYNPYEPSTNHAVAIVGWDDNFDKTNFKYTYDNALWESEGEDPLLPEKNGAWLIRNSWGPEVSDGGYFWISYEDASLEDGTAFAFDFNTANNYDHNYQYDGSTGTGGFGGAKQMTAAAVYTANGFQQISAVGVGFSSASVDYTIKVYTNLTNENNPESGTLAATTTGKTSYEGFYTIEIDNAVIIAQGEKFSIVVTVEKSDEVYLFADFSSDNWGWVKFNADTKNDKTYIKSDSTWYNFGKLYDGTFRIKAYTNDIELSADDENRILTNNMLEEIAPQEYNGGKVTPELTLVFNGEKLQKDTDYTVEYQNNEVPGTATVVITGKGSYRGEITAQFTITRKAITADMIKEISGWTYDGIDHAPDLAVYNGNNLMKLNEDYTVKFNKSSLIAAGTYTVTVTGKAPNYSGSAKKTFTVEKLNLEDAHISLEYDTAVYTGKELKPVVTVKAGENVIPVANYTLKYKDNKAAGTATVTITGKSNCLGTVERTFEINKKAITEDGISVMAAIYTGSEVKPAVTVKDGSTTLKLNQDYELSYSNNINATLEATVTVKGIGNYSGTLTKTFEIQPQTVAANKIKAEVTKNGSIYKCEVTVNGKKVENADDYAVTVKKAGTDTDVEEWQPGSKYDITVELKRNYRNANGTPVVVKNVVCKASVEGLNIKIVGSDGIEYDSYSIAYKGSAHKPTVRVKDGEQVLSTKSYSVSYVNNVNAGEASIVITGKGEYGGTISIPFTITKKQVDTLNVTIPAKTYTGSEIIPTVTIKDGRKKLKVGTDYTIDSYNKNVDATSDAEVHITLKNYALGDNNETNITRYFTINPAKISSVKLGSSYYLGDDIVVRPVLTVTSGKIVLAEEDYNAVFEGNGIGLTNKATVTVEGKGNFTGTKKVTFKITKESLSKVRVNGITDQVYTGKEITLEGINLVNSNGDAIPADNYTVTYKNNVKAGTASVTIKATADGLYSGSVTKKFKINKAELGDVIQVASSSLEAKTYTGGKLTYTANEIAVAVAPKAAGGEQPTYKVSYRNNINAGTATLILTGNGNYQGTVEVEFTIKPIDMSEVTVELKQTTVPYLGQGKPTLATIKKAVCGKLKLTEKKDYTLSYVNCDEAGLAAVKVTGKGNYTGTKTLYYYIKN